MPSLSCSFIHMGQFPKQLFTISTSLRYCRPCDDFFTQETFNPVSLSYSVNQEKRLHWRQTDMSSKCYALACMLQEPLPPLDTAQLPPRMCVCTGVSSRVYGPRHVCSPVGQFFPLWRVRGCAIYCTGGERASGCPRDLVCP